VCLHYLCASPEHLPRQTPLSTWRRSEMIRMPVPKLHLGAPFNTPRIPLARAAPSTFAAGFMQNSSASMRPATPVMDSSHSEVTQAKLLSWMQPTSPPQEDRPYLPSTIRVM